VQTSVQETDASVATYPTAAQGGHAARMAAARRNQKDKRRSVKPESPPKLMNKIDRQKRE